MAAWEHHAPRRGSGALARPESRDLALDCVLRMKTWVCANCKTPVEPVFHEAGYGEPDLYIRCPNDGRPGCSPLESRELRCADQIEAVNFEP